MHVRNGEWKKGRRFTPAQRAELIAKYQRRTETVRKFAEHHHVAVCTLRRWIKGAKAGRRPAPIFQEVPIVAGLNSWTAEVRLAGGTELRWNRGADPNVLAEVLRQLRQPC